jgi:hypothetical protein
VHFAVCAVTRKEWMFIFIVLYMCSKLRMDIQVYCSVCAGSKERMDMQEVCCAVWATPKEEGCASVVCCMCCMCCSDVKSECTGVLCCL